MRERNKEIEKLFQISRLLCHISSLLFFSSYVDEFSYPIYEYFVGNSSYVTRCCSSKANVVLSICRSKRPFAFGTHTPCAQRQVDSLCSALERNRDGLVLKSLKERGVTESKVLGQWWGKGLYLGGRACMNLGDNEKAVACFKKAIKV